jgi:glucokinase
MALKYLAKGGVFLAGGIAPAIAARLDSPVFMKAFMAKSKMERLLETIPVKIVLNDKAGMLGAARYARERM